MLFDSVNVTRTDRWWWQFQFVISFFVARWGEDVFGCCVAMLVLVLTLGGGWLAFCSGSLITGPSWSNLLGIVAFAVGIAIIVDESNDG
ncbi:MAG: hypothetical protein HY565_04485 [Candidatus Kerfeldbacteria bacterium]|nr:hypothetical protein [Candidatus Kerfeldbacteria bacterium]